MGTSRFIWAVLLPALTASIPVSNAQHVGSGLDKGEFHAFKRSLNVSEWGYAIEKDPTGKAPSTLVERFEVRPGDCQASGGWSDCDRGRERSELAEQDPLGSRGSEAWYGWSFFAPADWHGIWPAKTVLGQFHQIDSHPVWMFLQKEGDLVLDDQSAGGTRRYIPLIAGADFSGRWHRIEVHARWAADASGFFRVWVDGQQRFDHAGATMTAEKVYFRYGIYRSFLPRYEAAAGTPAPAQTILFANVRKAATRSGLNAQR